MGNYAVRYLSIALSNLFTKRDETRVIAEWIKVAIRIVGSEKALGRRRDTDESTKRYMHGGIIILFVAVLQSGTVLWTCLTRVRYRSRSGDRKPGNSQKSSDVGVEKCPYSPEGTVSF